MPHKVPRRTDPRWTIIRRTKFAYEVNDAMYGYEARPLGRIDRYSLARMLAHFTRARSLTYTETLNVARRWGEVARSVHGRFSPTPENHRFLRGMLCWHLGNAAREKAARSPRRDERARREDQRHHRFVAEDIQRVFDGKCFICREPLPCQWHGIDKVTFDEKGRPSPIRFPPIYELQRPRMNSAGTARREPRPSG